MKHRLFLSLPLLCAALSIEAKSKKPKKTRRPTATTSQSQQSTPPPLTKQPNALVVDMISMDTESVLACLQKYLPTNPIVVEAESYDGKDTKKMAALWPYGQIYAFEPVPENFINLEKNTLDSANIKRFPLALSNQNGMADFFSSAHITTPKTQDDTPQEPLIPDHGVIFNTVLSVPTITLDTWAQQNNIETVDLLWLDMQGYELNLIKSSPNILKTVTVIYTEVEFVKAYKEQYQYKDVKEFLENQGFIFVAKDFGELPIYWFGNAVFVRKEVLTKEKK